MFVCVGLSVTVSVPLLGLCLPVCVSVHLYPFPCENASEFAMCTLARVYESITL